VLIALLAHIAIPVIAGLCLVFFIRARDGITWASCNEVAIDFVLISIGATGALFLNPKLTTKWGPAAAIYGMLIVLGNLLFASILVYRGNRRHRNQEQMEQMALFLRPLPVTWQEGYVDLFFGMIGLVLTLLVYWFGYRE
jgi:hypothetical protein